MSKRAYRFLPFLVLAASASVAAVPSYTLVEVADLESPGTVWSLNDAGDVVGLSDGQGWVFRDGVLLQLRDLVVPPLPPSTALLPRDINDLGQICGRATSSEGELAFLLLGPDLTLFDPLPSFSDSSAYALNEMGPPVGVSKFDTGEGPAFRATSWTTGVAEDLGKLPGFIGSWASAVNGTGEKVGTSFNCGFGYPVCEARPTLWTAGMEDLGVLPGFFNSFGDDINDAGEVTGYAETEDQTARHGFLRRPGGEFIDLGGLPGYPFIDPSALNNAGQVVGEAAPGWSHTFAGRTAFLWHEGQMHDLNDLILPGSAWRLVDAKDINDAGQITAIAVFDADPGAYTPRAVRLDPVDVDVPASSSAGLVLLVVVLLAGGAVLVRQFTT